MKACGLAFALFFLAWALGVVAEARLASTRGDAGRGDFLDRILGQGRLALSVQFLGRADLYYHGGVADDDACLEHAEEHSGTSETAEEAQHHDQDMATQSVAPTDWWSRLNAQVHPSGHEHLKGERYEKEVLPWLWAAVQADPHNVKAYEIGGYWLGRRLAQPADALQLLKDGKAKNPGAYALDAAIGDLYLDVLKRDADAYAAYREAERNWRRRAVTDNDKDARLAGAWILTHLAILDEKSGRLESALARYREALPLVVDPAVLAGRVANLESTLARQPKQPAPTSVAPAPP